MYKKEYSGKARVLNKQFNQAVAATVFQCAVFLTAYKRSKPPNSAAPAAESGGENRNTVSNVLREAEAPL